jgi:hypothetical protein
VQRSHVDVQRSHVDVQRSHVELQIRGGPRKHLRPGSGPRSSPVANNDASLELPCLLSPANPVASSQPYFAPSALNTLIEHYPNLVVMQLDHLVKCLDHEKSGDRVRLSDLRDYKPGVGTYYTKRVNEKRNSH